MIRMSGDSSRLSMFGSAAVIVSTFPSVDVVLAGGEGKQTYIATRQSAASGELVAEGITLSSGTSRDSCSPFQTCGRCRRCQISQQYHQQQQY